MKAFISDEEKRRLEREDIERGHLLANVFMPMARVDRPAAPVVDETGRAWTLPDTDAGLHAILARYVELHGRLSPEVDATFTAFGRLNELRVLVMRCAEGECLNLAARALALGPVPVRLTPPRPPGWPSDKPRRGDTAAEGFARADARRHAAVAAEAQRMRAAGYKD